MRADLTAATAVDSVAALAQARRLLPLAEHALTWWDRFAASAAEVFVDRPDLLQAPRRAVTLARTTLAAGDPPAVDELAETARLVQAAGELVSSYAQQTELAWEASAALGLAAVPLAFVALAHGLADALDWQVEATIDFAVLAGEQIHGLGDPHLDALLDELE